MCSKKKKRKKKKKKDIKSREEKKNPKNVRARSGSCSRSCMAWSWTSAAIGPLKKSTLPVRVRSRLRCVLRWIFCWVNPNDVNAPVRVLVLASFHGWCRSDSFSSASAYLPCLGKIISVLTLWNHLQSAELSSVTRTALWGGQSAGRTHTQEVERSEICPQTENFKKTSTSSSLALHVEFWAFESWILLILTWSDPWFPAVIGQNSPCSSLTQGDEWKM